MKTKRASKPISKRTAARLRRLKSDPFGRLSLAVADYLDSIGWSAVVVGNPAISGDPAGRVANFTFTVQFTGGKKKERS